MNIVENYLEKTKINKHRFSARSGIPYSTICDICSEKTPLKKCSAETIYKLSKATKISADTILESACSRPKTYDWFKSEVCHEVKRRGDLEFMVEILKSNVIRSYFDQGKYEESLYLLGMLDYLSRKNNIPLCKDYNDLRCRKFREPIFPQSLLVKAEVMQDESVKTEAVKNAIPEFIRFNIVENEVENVC